LLLLRKSLHIEEVDLEEEDGEAQPEVMGAIEDGQSDPIIT
jgi:hypothetical protein